MAVWPDWCIQRNNLYIYSSHFLSTWGDHMWLFGSGLLLIEILPDSLQLTAIYGLSVGLTVLLLGAVVGDWVDRTPRLKAVQIALVLQKSFIVLSVATVYGYMMYRDSSQESMEAWKRNLCYGLIILFAVLGNLSQVARVITIERDWIVEMSAGDRDMLAHMTATMRRIDLGTMIIAPIVTGQIMSSLGLKVGSLFIGAWNAVSVFFGYFLMWKVYKTVPSLQKPKISENVTELTLMNTQNNVDEFDQLTPEKQEEKVKIASFSEPHSSEQIVIEFKGRTYNLEDYTPSVHNHTDQLTTRRESILSWRSGAPTTSPTCTDQIFYSFTTLYRGMKTYRGYSVHRAGLGLACLYLTVLGFDGVTVGYIYTQGISEDKLGLLMGGAAIVGVIGTIAYPIIRRHVGIVRTGLCALACHWIFILTCVVSVFLPGSPFDPWYWSRSDFGDPYEHCGNNNTVLESVGLGMQPRLINSSIFFNGSNDILIPCPEPEIVVTSSISIIVFMTGIIGARFGLWTADLAITQLFLESVEEAERGVVNGVQTSINMLMDMLKFALVVGLPKPPLFGFLAIISFCSVTSGDLLYASYSRKTRGHLIHFGNCGGKQNQKVEARKVINN